MGLDMYLSKKIYVGATYEHRGIRGTISLTQNGRLIDISLDKVKYIIEEAAYWRKANQIHSWFVENVQGGVDECQESYVSYEQLMQLKSTCEEALRTKNSSLLPTKSGFFFGSTDYDSYYWSDLENTVEQLSNLDPHCDYYYQASW